MACGFYLFNFLELCSPLNALPISTVRPVVEDEDRVVVILGGSPRDAGWTALANDGAAQMEAARLELEKSGALENKHTSHRRGDFTACAIGCSHGGGRKVCVEPPRSYLSITSTIAARPDC
jgi:hypothetical protein